MNIYVKFAATTLATVALGALALRADAQTSTNSDPNAAMTALFGDPVVAKGKGFEIKRSSLDQIMVGAKGQAASANQKLPEDFDARALNQLISIQLLVQTATDADKAAGAADAEVQYTNLLAHFGSEEAFLRQLKAVGMTVDDLKHKANQEATAKAALKRALNVEVTDDDVKKFYASRPGDFEEPEKVHVRHLLLMTIDPQTHASLAADDVAVKRKQIDALLKRARGGEDFATLARQYSEDPGSKDSGGEYTFPRGQMVPEFEAAAFSMTNGQISDVVITKYGFHIIKLLDRVPAHTVPLEKVSEDIKNYLVQQKVNKLAPDYIKKLKQQYDVQILDADLKTKLDAAEAAAAAEANMPAGGLPSATAPAGGSKP